MNMLGWNLKKKKKSKNQRSHFFQADKEEMRKGTKRFWRSWIAQPDSTSPELLSCVLFITDTWNHRIPAWFGLKGP